MSATEQQTGGWVGQAIRRKEDPPLITGRAQFVDDISLPGMLWVAVVRSPEAHAKISSVDASAALGREDIHAVYTGEDMSDLLAPLPMAWAPPREVLKQIGAVAIECGHLCSAVDVDTPEALDQLRG